MLPLLVGLESFFFFELSGAPPYGHLFVPAKRPYIILYENPVTVNTVKGHNLKFQIVCPSDQLYS